MLPAPQLPLRGHGRPLPQHQRQQRHRQAGEQQVAVEDRRHQRDAVLVQRRVRRDHQAGQQRVARPELPQPPRRWRPALGQPSWRVWITTVPTTTSPIPSHRQPGQPLAQEQRRQHRHQDRRRPPRDRVDQREIAVPIRLRQRPVVQRLQSRAQQDHHPPQGRDRLGEQQPAPRPARAAPPTPACRTRGTPASPPPAGPAGSRSRGRRQPAAPDRAPDRPRRGHLVSRSSSERSSMTHQVPSCRICPSRPTPLRVDALLTGLTL